LPPGSMRYLKVGFLGIAGKGVRVLASVNRPFARVLL